MTALGHGEKNSRRAYLVRIASNSGIPKCNLMERVRIAQKEILHSF